MLRVIFCVEGVESPGIPHEERGFGVRNRSLVHWSLAPFLASWHGRKILVSFVSRFATKISGVRHHHDTRCEFCALSSPDSETEEKAGNEAQLCRCCCNFVALQAQNSKGRQ